MAVDLMFFDVKFLSRRIDLEAGNKVVQLVPS
jgi:hypothetical protein